MWPHVQIKKADGIKKNVSNSFLLIWFITLKKQDNTEENKKVIQNCLSGIGGIGMEFSAVNTIWVLVGAALVFFMQAGFAMVETGFTRAKNAGNIIMKNLMDFCIGKPVYWFVGLDLTELLLFPWKVMQSPLQVRFLQLRTWQQQQQL